MLVAAAAATDDANRVHVVSVRWRTGAKCAARCTGFMVTQRAVLTAASCSGPVAKPAAAVAAKPANTPPPRPLDEDAIARAHTSADDVMDRDDGDQSEAATEPAAVAAPVTTTAKATTVVAETPEAAAAAAAAAAVTATPPDEETENESFSKTIVKIKCPPNAITVSLHNTKGYTHTEVRMVIEKYVHPDWNPKTHVGDLAMLIINNPFSQFNYVKFPYMIGNDKNSVPQTLNFRGFAKLHRKSMSGFPSYKNGETGIPDEMAKRTLVVELSPDACPMVENSTLNPNWWSFLCTKPKDARTEISNTLCNEDIGGPLYALEGDRLWLYGVFSHAYHATYPVCAERLCYRLQDAPYPCNEGADTGTYYRHTAVLGRYASWLRRVVETYARASTVAPTADCPTESPEIGPDGTPDPLYDVDLYDGRRHMVENRKVCPRDRSRTSGRGGVGRVIGDGGAAAAAAAAAVLVAWTVAA